MHRFYDLTHSLGCETPVFPGDKPVRLHRVAEIPSQGYRAARMELGTHAGTHVDAPAHLLPDGARLGDLPLDLWVGRALLLDLSDLPGASLKGTPRLLLGGCPDGISPEWAHRIAEAGIRLLGVDGPSVDPVDSRSLPAHQALLSAGAVLVENLRLDGVPRGKGTLYCLPLPVDSGDGAPARVLWEPSEDPGRDP